MEREVANNLIKKLFYEKKAGTGAKKSSAQSLSFISKMHVVILSALRNKHIII